MSDTEDKKEETVVEPDEETKTTENAAETKTAKDETIAESGAEKKSIKIRTIRAIVCAFVFVAICIGFAFHTGTGTLSSFGWDYIATICPLGALESMLGAHAFIPRAAIAFVAIAIIVLLIGKGFCGWICPIPHFTHFFGSKKQNEADAEARNKAAELATSRWKNKEKVERKKVNVDSRHGVLAGALLSTAIFGFPVFCLVCPVGLTFATVIAIWRAVQFNEPTWGILIFPVIIVLEVVVFRKWCGTLCPLGAIISLISHGNKTFVPTVDTSKCLRDKDGVACRACDAACPEHLDPHSDLGERPMVECVKCASCVDACPAKALSIKLLKMSNKEQT